MNFGKIMIDIVSPPENEIRTFEIENFKGDGIRNSYLEELDLTHPKSHCRDVGLYRIHSFDKCRVIPTNRNVSFSGDRNHIDLRLSYRHIQVRPENIGMMGLYNLVVQNGWDITPVEYPPIHGLYVDKVNRRQVLEIELMDTQPPRGVSFALHLHLDRGYRDRGLAEKLTRLDPIDYLQAGFANDGRTLIPMHHAKHEIKEMWLKSKRPLKTIWKEYLNRYAIEGYPLDYNEDRLADVVKHA